MSSFNTGRWSSLGHRPSSLRVLQAPYRPDSVRASSPIPDYYSEAYDELGDEIDNTSPSPYTIQASQAQWYSEMPANVQTDMGAMDHEETAQEYGYVDAMDYYDDCGALPGAYTDEMTPRDHNASQRHPQAHWTSSPQTMESIGSHKSSCLIHENVTGGRLAQAARNRSSQRIKLKPVSQLPDVYRAIFKKYGTFNAIQSACFDHLMETDENLVLSAPTGSGKTVLFELAMIRLQINNKSSSHLPKCVYIAPTKALCTEKYNDWSTKFSPIGLKCCELTGDTSIFGRDIWAQAKDASIIVTTGEKWDSLTRNWSDHERILSLVHLLLVDEVHVLGEGRGSTLEVVVSRMKMRGSATRFILVSATVPNIEDIAAWIGNSRKTGPARVLKFGEEYRPCKLARHVAAFSRRREQNDFQFAKILDSKLFGVIQQHSAGKPILVFVSTRKGVFSTAEKLMQEYKSCESKRLPVPWAHPSRVDALFHDKRLTEFATSGIGVHHAGLTMEDRRTTEQLYIQKQTQVLITTSTLAVGVNLPAHLVIIRGVQSFQNGTSVEYSDVDIMQMLGRAGRPQFDTEGTAVIMCESDLAPKYQSITQGTTVLESSLHRNLAEHINSEIGLGTITSLESAKAWLRESFLFQRLQKNPAKYSIEDEDDQSTWQERMDNVVLKSINELEANQLVRFKQGSRHILMSTEYGEIMSKFYIRQNTMVDILTSVKNASLRNLLELISRADEFSGSKPRATEKSICNILKKHPDIRFEVRKVESAADKTLVLIQAILGGISLNAPEYQAPDCQLSLEVFGIFRHVDRIARAIVEVATVQKHGRQVKDGLELVRSLSAKAWEDRPVVMRQIDRLGEKSIKILAENGITTLEKLRLQNPIRIEVLLNRNPGFGHEILGMVNAIPRYEIKIKELSLRADKGAVEVELAIECALLNSETSTQKQKKSKSKGFNMTSILTISSDGDFFDFRRIQTKALASGKSFTLIATLTKPSQSAIVVISSETFAGTVVQAIYKPKVEPQVFRPPNTKPCTAIEMDLAGLEDDPDFWKMSIDDSSDDVKGEGPKIEVAVKDEIQPRPTPDKSASQARQLLPNGAYECNHPCKDKTKCRHYCCKEGLPKPPFQKHARGKEVTTRNEKPDESKAKTATKVRRLHTTTPSRSISNARAERELKQLQKLHDGVNTSEHLRLSTGRKLKLSPSSVMQDKSRRLKRPKLPVEFKLSDIGESAASVSQNAPVDITDDEEEDLHLPISILAPLPSHKNKSTSSSSPKHLAPRALSISSDEDTPVIVPSKRLRTHEVGNSARPETPQATTVARSPSLEALFLPEGTSEIAYGTITPSPPPENDAEDFFSFALDQRPPSPKQLVSTRNGFQMQVTRQDTPEESARINHEETGGTGFENDSDEFFEEYEQWLGGGDVQIIPL